MSTMCVELLMIVELRLYCDIDELRNCIYFGFESNGCNSMNDLLIEFVFKYS